VSLRDWDAACYERVSDPMFGWGLEVLDRLSLDGDETVLDAGCGSGRVTARLLERLPDGHVVAVDASPSMVEQAREQLDPDRTTVFAGDLLELELDEPVDAAISTAVFHWIPDHPRLFMALRQVLRPGGRLVAQFGGGSNLQRFMRAADTVASREPFAPRLDGKALWRYYATPEETEARLEEAGFKDAQAWLEPSPQTFSDPAALADFCRGVVLSNHMAVLPDNLRQAFADQVVDEIALREGRLCLDYVRLNVDASA
jgi:trans-aconitate 2-methyltransferase